MFRSKRCGWDISLQISIDYFIKIVLIEDLAEAGSLLIAKSNNEIIYTPIDVVMKARGCGLIAAVNWLLARLCTAAPLPKLNEPLSSHYANDNVP